MWRVVSLIDGRGGHALVAGLRLARKQYEKKKSKEPRAPGKEEWFDEVGAAVELLEESGQMRRRGKLSSLSREDGTRRASPLLSASGPTREMSRDLQP